MELWIALLAGLIGYLCGSFSAARLVARYAAPGKELSLIRYPIPNTDIVFESDSVSASMVRIQVGTRYGCLTAILDILKVFLPVLAFRLWQPDAPYFLVVAALGLVGHNWPLYHRFMGGRGESTILGGMLAIDPVGLVVTNLAGILFGWLTGELLVLRWSFLLLLIPWLWLRTGDPAYGSVRSLHQPDILVENASGAGTVFENRKTRRFEHPGRGRRRPGDGDALGAFLGPLQPSQPAEKSPAVGAKKYDQAVNQTQSGHPDPGHSRKNRWQRSS
jgi:glycerol-3-phosphate acyltransferase PlsY